MNDTAANPGLTSAGLPRVGPIRAYVGSASPRILFIGEAFGEREALMRQPFVGTAGKELFSMLGEAMPGLERELHASIAALHRYGDAWVNRRQPWLDAAQIGFTNVFNLRPPDNKLEHFLGSKEEVGGTGGFTALQKGKFLRGEYYGELDRLERELVEFRPNLVVALGNTALWAVTGTTAISAVRGTVRQGEMGAWTGKVLPTYHPAGVLRQWSWRPIVVADLVKAFRESEFPEIRRPSRRVLVSPTLAELREWVEDAERRVQRREIAKLSIDIETAFKQITEIGFARSRSEAVVVPFVDRAKPGWSFWPTLAEELEAWGWVDRLFQLRCPKLFQNGLYDLQYILPLGFQPAQLGNDTMLRHHALFPEMQKGLGFLGSVYASEPAWKLMRRKRPDTEKRDE